MSGPIEGNSSGIVPGVLGSNTVGIGVWGTSDSGNAVYGISNTAAGVYGESSSGNAGEFHGKVVVTGNVAVTGNIVATGNVKADDVILSGSDCAEEFDVANALCLEPGTVVVVNSEGSIRECGEPYNKRVAGVISGAGAYRPAVILGHDGSSAIKARVALMGRVYCKVDASYAPIDIGDMLTTSPTSGCAMKASDPSMAFGAAIGKALASVSNGRHLIPILLALR